MYFDAVLDDNGYPVFNGTPEETKKWLKENESASELSVGVGQTLRVISVREYLAKA